MKFKLSLWRPISKREMLEHRYELATLTSYVKELEAINRNDILTLIKKVDIMDRKKLSKIDDTIEYEKDGLEIQ